MATKSLSVEEVNARLVSYESQETTKELYDFGKMMVGECVERVHKIDSKATMLAGYGGAIIALLISTSSLWMSIIDKWAMVTVFAAAFAVLMSAAYAVWSFSPKTFDWFSDNEWFEKDYLSDPEQLRRYHILTMHNVVRSHDAVSKTKTKRIRTSQRLLGVGTLLLVVALADTVWKSAA